MVVITGPCGEMSQNQGDKLFRVFGGVNGEMQIDDIPPAPGVNIEAIKKGDTDPLEVVVEVPVGKSKRGWNYTKQALIDIVNKVNTATLNGLLGHQKAEDVSTQFVAPVTHWIGAKMTDTAAYFRGIIDQDATSLKRYIRSGRVKEVSIFGRPTLQKSSTGGTDVINYDAMSIDWTPLGRPGMPTSIVAMSGEMWDPEYLGPTGEMNNEKTEGNGEKMDWAKVIEALKLAYGNKTVTFGMIAGEMGISEEQVIKELTPDFAKRIGLALETLEAAKQLGVTGEMQSSEITSLFASAKQALDNLNQQAAESVYGEMMTEKIQSDAVRGQLTKADTILGKLWFAHKATIPANADKTVIAGEMDKFLGDPVVKGVMDGVHTDRNTFTGGSSSQQQSSGAATRRTASI